MAGLVPLGQDIYDIAQDAIRLYREECDQGDLQKEVEEMVQADPEAVRQAARDTAREVLAGQPEEEVVQLENYLTQVPAVARKTLARPKDPSGCTVPALMDLTDPAQLMTLLPRRLPRFRPGEPVPNASQWQLEQLLGSGGFGEVWLARHTFLDRRRAYKFCLDLEARDRLLRHEARIIDRVRRACQLFDADDHGIVILEDACLEGESPWLAYEYVEGSDLAMLIREQANKPPARRGRRMIQLLINLARVIGKLHTLPEPIIHRDLKPANILLKRHADRWLLRVTDFGVSHIVAERRLQETRQSHPTLGETYRGAYSPIYASPQQRRGMPADVRDDVYALGIIGWQILVGDLSAERPAGKWRQRVVETKLPAQVFDILESCWDDDPRERPENAAVVAERLRQAMRSQDESRQDDEPATPPLPPTSAAAPTATGRSSPVVSVPEQTVDDQVTDLVARLGGHMVRNDALPGRPVVEVDLRFTAVTDEDLAVVGKLNNLALLYLGSTSITDNGVAFLASLRNSLQVLDLSCTAITDRCLSTLAALSQLTLLDLRGATCTDDFVLRLRQHLPYCHVWHGPPLLYGRN